MLSFCHEFGIEAVLLSIISKGVEIEIKELKT